MSFATAITPSDARAVVKLAITKVKSSMAKDWLFKDEKGTWERQVQDLLLDEATQARAIPLGITTDEALREAVADHIAFLAVDAVLRNALKGT